MTTVAHSYAQAQYLLAPDASDADAQLAGTKLQRPYPLTGALIWGTIQFVYLSPYYRETLAGIPRAYWTADDGSCTEYILLNDISMCTGCHADCVDDILDDDSLCPACHEATLQAHDPEYEDWLDSLWEDEREARLEVARCRFDEKWSER